MLSRMFEVRSVVMRDELLVEMKGRVILVGGKSCRVMLMCMRVWLMSIVVMF